MAESVRVVGSRRRGSLDLVNCGGWGGVPSEMVEDNNKRRRCMGTVVLDLDNGKAWLPSDLAVELRQAAPGDG